MINQNIPPVWHRSEYYFGGEQGYIDRINNYNENLIEVPIDDSLQNLTGKLKLNVKYKYKKEDWFVAGGTYVEEVNLCDDCYGEKDTKEVEADYTCTLAVNPCLEAGFISYPSYSICGTVHYKAEEKLHDGGPTPPTYSCFSECGQKAGIEAIPISGTWEVDDEPEGFFSFRRTEYAKQPFYHDYTWYIGWPKGLGVQATFKIGEQEYKAEYESLIEGESCGGDGCGYHAWRYELYYVDIELVKIST